MSKMNNLVVENATIMFRNFSGKEGRYNDAGQRNFCLMIPDDVVERVKADGWNVRTLRPKDPDDPPAYYIQVAVKFEYLPPKILMISSGGKSQISESNVDILDWAEIKTCDVIVRPREWTMNGRQGVKAYLKSLYVTIEEDEFESKYANTPDSSKGCVGGCGNCDVCDGGCHE